MAGLGTGFMKPVVVNAKRAALGWPFYATWNVVAFMKEQETLEEKATIAVCGILVLSLTTALWAAAWLLIISTIWQAAS